MTYKYITLNKRNSQISININDVLDNLKKNNLPHCFHSNNQLFVPYSTELNKFCNSKIRKAKIPNINIINNKVNEHIELMRRFDSLCNNLILKSKSTKNVYDGNTIHCYNNSNTFEFFLDYHYRSRINKSEKLYYEKISKSHINKLAKLALNLKKYFNKKYSIYTLCYHRDKDTEFCFESNSDRNIVFRNEKNRLVDFDREDIYTSDLYDDDSNIWLQSILGPDIFNEILHYEENDILLINKYDDSSMTGLINEFRYKLNGAENDLAEFIALNSI